MPTAILIDKKGSIKEVVLKTFAESDLYKKAGFKAADGFQNTHTWTIDAVNKSYNITLYGKVTGRAGQENKYDFPPPVDNILFFGSCVLVNNLSEDKTTIDSVTKDEWKILYDHLFGGFEDLGSEDSTSLSDDEDDIDAGLPRTKSGYAKDGFIVEDGVLEDEDDDEDESEEEESDISEVEEVHPTKKMKKVVPAKKKAIKEKVHKVPQEKVPQEKVPKEKVPKEKVSKEKVSQEKVSKDKKKSTVFDRIVEEPLVVNDSFMDCTSELEEEEYM